MDGISESIVIGEGGHFGKVDAAEELRKRIRTIGETVGMSSADIEISAQCVVAEPRPCIKNDEHRSFNLGLFLAESKLLSISLVLMFLGLLGTVLFKPICCIYRSTFQKLWLWIRG